MNDSHKIASRLEDYLDSGYFAGTIQNIYALINHIYFLEMQVSALKDTIARMQEEKEASDGHEVPGC